MPVSWPNWEFVKQEEPPRIPNWTREYADQMRDNYEGRQIKREKDEREERGASGKTEQHLIEEREMKRASSIYNFLGELPNESISNTGENVVVINKYLRENLDDKQPDLGISAQEALRFRRYCRKEAVYSLSHENYQTLIRRFARAREDRNSNFEAIRSQRTNFENRGRETPLIREHSYVRQKSRSPTQRTRSPMQRARSPIERSAMQRSGSPMQYRNRSPVQRPRSPVQRRGSPMVVSSGFTQRARSPMLRTRSPMQRGRSPMHRARSPMQRARSPMQRARSPMQRGRSPMERGRSPMQNRNRSPVTRPRSPTQRYGSPMNKSRSPRRSSRSPRRRSNFSPDRKYINLD